jgi:lysine/ornithine N-monooxygenase
MFHSEYEEINDNKNYNYIYNHSKNTNNDEMHIENKEVIIIGAGISGIIMAKHLKEKEITNILIIDKNPEPFGVWNIKNHPSVLETTYCVTSKKYMSMTDYPIPDDYPEFPHHSQILQYYTNYATHFDILKYIKTNTTISNVKKENNEWIITTSDKIYSCKKLIIACGTVNDALNIPKDKMYTNFTGDTYHSDEFSKIQQKLKNKKILLIGVSDTSCDIAEVLKTENKVAMSSNRGVWFQDRINGAQVPSDSIYSNMINVFTNKIFGKHIQHYFFGNSYLFVKTWWGFNGHGVDEWKTDAHYLNTYFVKSRDVVHSIAKGQITPYGKILTINDNTVFFNNNKKDKFDVIIFCTGYKPFGNLNFIDKKYTNKIYKNIFSINDTSLAFIGYVRPYLTGMPYLIELQARWVSMQLKHGNTLSTKKHMEYEHSHDLIKLKKEFPHNYKRLSVIVDPYYYANMIAKKINALPNLFLYFFTNPSLFYKLMINSWDKYQFSLNNVSAEKKQNALNNINKVHMTFYNKDFRKWLSVWISIITLFIVLFIIILYFFIKFAINVRKFKK